MLKYKTNTNSDKVQYTTIQSSIHNNIHNVQYATLFCYTQIPKLLKQICKVQVIKSNETKTHLPNTEALKLICKIYNKTIFCILQKCFKTKLQNTKAIVIQAQNLDGFNWYFEILQNPSRSFKSWDIEIFCSLTMQYIRGVFLLICYLHLHLHTVRHPLPLLLRYKN